MVKNKKRVKKNSCKEIRFKKDLVLKDQVPPEEMFFFKDGNEFTCNRELHTEVKRLYVIGQPLQALREFKPMPNLSHLWTVECALKEIDLSNYMNLKKLYLYSNNFSHIPPLVKLDNLEVLWLANNRISSIENLDNFPNLKELNLANNHISSIGDGLKPVKMLKTLNIAGNPVHSLSEIQSLKCLTNLMELTIIDPLYNRTPIASLNNYRPYVLYWLPNLSCLDHYEVDEREKQSTNAFFHAKLRYYSMLFHKTLREYHIGLADHMEEAYLTLRSLKARYLQSILKEAKAAANGDKARMERCKLELEHLENHKMIWETGIDQLQSIHDTILEVKLKQMDFELEFIGNVNFIAYSRSSSVAVMCEKIMNDFICPSTLKKMNLERIEVEKVFELRTTVTSPFIPLKCMSGMINENVKSPCSQFYLLQDPISVRDFSEWPFQYLRRKFKCREVIGSAHKVTNCITAADPTWLCHSNLRKSVVLSKKGTGRNRMALLVYLSHHAQTATEKTSKYAGIHSEDSKELSGECQVLRVHNPHHIHPKFIIEFRYVFKKPEDFHNNEALLSFQKLQTSELTCPEILIAPPTLEDLKWDSLVVLTLEKQNITNLELSKVYESVKTLDISYNNLDQLKEISFHFPNLVSLNASFNNITSLHALKAMRHLEVLDLSWNNICLLMPLLRTIRISAPLLKNLCLKYNPIEDIIKTKKTISFILKIFPRLESYNDESTSGNIDHKVLENLDEFQVIYRDEEKRKNNMSVFWDGARCVMGKERHGSHLGYEGEAQELVCMYVFGDKTFHKLKPKISLASLRSLTLYRVGLTSANEFISKMPLLEELDLTGNALVEINLPSFTSLKRINLSDNCLSNLNGFHSACLPSLKVLNLSKNQISMINGLHDYDELVEFYISLNKLCKMESVNKIKSWKSLRIVDMSYNKFEDYNELRKFLIFHLPRIEYINGEGVHDVEFAEVSSSLRTHLDIDYLLKYNRVESLDELKELTIRRSLLKKVNLNGGKLINLTSVNLEGNFLTELCGLSLLTNLKALCLSNNQVTSWGDGIQQKTPSQPFPSLESLHLDSNGIQVIERLELYRIPKLKILFLHENQISSTCGLKRMKNLQFLVLDRNKLTSFDIEKNNDLENLSELYLEGNTIQELDFLTSLPQLKKIFLANNHIYELETLKYFKNLPKLKEITIAGNPICRSPNHYKSLLNSVVNLKLLDGHELDFTP